MNDIRASLMRVLSIDIQYHVVLVSIRAKAEVPYQAAQMHLLSSYVIGYDFSRLNFFKPVCSGFNELGNREQEKGSLCHVETVKFQNSSEF